MKRVKLIIVFESETDSYASFIEEGGWYYCGVRGYSFCDVICGTKKFFNFKRVRADVCELENSGVLAVRKVMINSESGALTVNTLELNIVYTESVFVLREDSDKRESILQAIMRESSFR